MNLKTKLFGKVYAFKDLKDVLAKANEEKSGDRLAGIAAEDDAERQQEGCDEVEKDLDGFLRGISGGAVGEEVSRTKASNQRPIQQCSKCSIHSSLQEVERQESREQQRCNLFSACADHV